jgi:VWFA-related protein
VIRRILPCLLVAIAGAEYHARSPQSNPPQQTFTTGVELVRLDVSVLDKDRRPVRGLTARDFTVLDDGNPQPIVAFSEVDIPDAEPAAAEWMQQVGSDIATNQLDLRRIIVIVMDDGTTSVDDGAVNAAKQIARGVIGRLGPNDLAAVVFTLEGKSQNFTSDRRRLIAAADSFAPKAIAAPGKWTAAESSRGPSVFAGPPLACLMPGGGPNCLTRTLNTVATALEDTPVGRKTIVLISSGLPYNFSISSLEASSDLNDLQRTFRSLQAANVNVYPFDPRGLTSEGILSDRLDSLRIFADHTGGRATLATNTPWEQVPQVFAENSSYYLLGIRPPESGRPGSFRRVNVKVARAGADVRVRAGYFAPGRETRAKTRESAPPTVLDKAFGAALPSGTLPLEAGATPFAAPGNQAIVVVTAAVRRPVTESVAIETLEVRTAAFDAGSLKERTSERQTAELTLRPTALGERRFELQSRLAVRPGRYEIRVAAAVAGTAGGVFTLVEVPDFAKARLSLSGLVLGMRRSDQNDRLADVLPIVPTAGRSFTPSARVTAFLRVYQGGKGAVLPVQIRVRIVDASSRNVVDDASTLEPARFQSGRFADYSLDLPLSRLGAGDYLLTVEATAQKNSARRDVRFQVTPQDLLKRHSPNS